MGDPEQAVLEGFVLALEGVELPLVEGEPVLEVHDSVAGGVVDWTSHALLLDDELAVFTLALLLHPSYYSDNNYSLIAVGIRGAETGLLWG